TDTITTCNGCHTLDPANGFFGADGRESFENEPQNMKIAHLRNLYQKIGMFGTSNLGGPGTDQVRGFGFLHDGSVGSVDDFLNNPVFNLNAAQRAEMEQFMLAFPTDLAPIVGQQVTLTGSNSAAVNARIDLLLQQSAATFTSLILGGTATECDLVVKGQLNNQPRGWLRQGNGDFLDDTGATISEAALRALPATEGPLTFTCAVPGSGTRMALDRDEDTVLDGNDNCAAAANTGQVNTDGDGQGDACDSDDDNDELGDAQEQVLGTDPLKADTDGDTYSDGFEVSFGTDPLSAASSPDSMQVPVLPWLASILLMASLAATVVWRRRLQ
ncbi:MAG: thrombospondin type 3 repeat-containing protein, partial [Gammaproteobacteria bacterium]|nr:thrombospondin type 3 repeat-containing protein [Gammaproteobacteria bacterium]